jgi:hypothetical protein
MKDAYVVLMWAVMKDIGLIEIKVLGEIETTHKSWWRELYYKTYELISKSLWINGDYIYIIWEFFFIV